jgi:two-component system chemotaxis sensor kinase CheA
MASDADFLAGFMDDYFVECEEHLAAIRAQLLELERGVGAAAVPPAVLEDLFRSFHSIKGISGMVELREAEMLAHQMESYLRALRQREVVLSQRGVDALIAGVKALEATIAARRDEKPLPPIDRPIQELVAVTPAAPAVAPAAAPAAGAPVSEGGASWRVTFTPSAERVARGINVDTVRARLRDLGTIVDATPRVLPEGIAFEFLFAGDLTRERLEEWRADGVVAESLGAAAARVASLAALDAPAGEAIAAGEGYDGSADASRLGAAHVVRVEMSRLDELMRMIGDLVIGRARLESALARVERYVPPVEWRSVQENSQTIERQLRVLREGVIRVRLVPVREIFRRMPFVVRDLARETDKRVRLDLRGQETEIDKYLIERMMDPVLHLVRNAVSHGFETASERAAAGKPEEGTLTLSASSVGDSVLLEVADDGRGIDPAAVAARARAMGVPLPEGELSARALLDVLCAPGFSTRDETDRASGRGVGMAVVKATVEELNGTISLDTAPGEGTRFLIELPLTLSITDALIAHVGERTFAVPQSQVREVIEIDPAGVRRVGEHEIAPFRGGSLPILRLARLFGIDAAARRALHLFVVGTGRDAIGIAVDRISGQREIVVRRMADQLIDVDFVAGATDLGDGRVVLILDLPALGRERMQAAAAGSSR